jgi:aromatic ring-opening dioxygenase catalytic subunit (LigB family)
MGLALSELRDSNIAIIGSGSASFHNLRVMFSGLLQDPAFKARNQEWNDALTEAVTEESSAEREKKLERWRKFPGSYEMHPRNGADHFLPLIVCAGAGGNGAAGMYKDEFMGLDMYSYYWN